MSDLICEFCANGDCSYCQDEKCECECNSFIRVDEKDVPSEGDLVKKSDVGKKIIAITGGVGAVVAGTALTFTTGGVGALAGGALTSAGISSIWQGGEKLIRRKSLDPLSYCLDVGTGAVIGLATCGIGAVGERLVLQGIKKAEIEVATRIGIGGVCSVAAKAVEETNECLKCHKSWKYFGKTLNEEGKVSPALTAASWGASALSGVAGSTVGLFSSKMTQQTSNDAIKCAAKCIAGGTAPAIKSVTNSAIEAATINSSKDKSSEMLETIECAKENMVLVDWKSE